MAQQTNKNPHQLSISALVEQVITQAQPDDITAQRVISPLFNGNAIDSYNQLGANRTDAKADLEAVRLSVAADYTWPAIFKRMISRDK